MAVRTIKVDITGLKEIEKAQKSVSALRDSVLDFEKKLGKMGGKNTSPLSFNVKLMFNTDKALKDYLALKKQIEGIPIKINTTKGTAQSGIVQEPTTRGRRERTFSADYIKVKDQDYQSWRNLHRAIQDVSNSTFSLSSQMLKLGAVNPAKGLLSVFNKVNSTILGIQGNLMGLVGNKVTGAIGTAVNATLGSVRSGIGQLKDEANNLGDAMQVYRINMQALGFDEKSVNKSIKRLGDYGKATVFDATDLLEQASTYTAYGRKDSEQIVKGYAGLLAQTKNPIEGMKTVTEQTAQMLAAGVLNQQDYKFIRQRLSALGASRLNAELQKLAESKGADSIISATKKRLITADEYLDVVNKLGNEDTFQNLVNSIITPRQAIANLKETLSNLLVFDDIDEEGNAKPGALNQVYVATRDFIKGITEIVGTEKFKEYVTRLGNAIGGTIQQVNQFGSAWKLAFSKQFTEGIEHFAKAFNEGVKGLDVGAQFFNVTKSFLGVLNKTGRQFGTFVRDIVKSGAELVESLAKLASQAITGGALRVLSGIVDIYNNIAKLAVNSEAIRIVSSLYLNLTDTINTLVKSINPTDVNTILTALKGFVGSMTSVVTKLATKTNLFSELTNVVKGVLEAISDIVLQIGTFRPSQVNSVLQSLRKVILGIVNSLKPLIVELGRGALNVLSSASGQNFFSALQGFVKSVVEMIRSILISIGGSVEGGLKAILNFFTLAINTASTVAKLLGGVGKYLIAGALATKFLTWASSIIYTLSTVATAMNNVSGGRVNPLGLAGAFGSDTLVRQGVTSRGVNTSVAYSGMSRVARNAPANSPYGLSRVGRNKAKAGARAKGLGLLGAQMAVEYGNNALQNSSASQGWKDAGNVLSSTASWASTGALIGSAFTPIGTGVGAGIGALIGLGTSLFGVYNDTKERLKAKEEAEKQAKEEAKEVYLQRAEHLRQIAQENKEIRNQYFKSITKDSSLTDQIAGANALIESVKNNSGGTITTALKELGVETSKIPQNINDTFVKVGDKIRSWKDLKEETGLNDEQLLNSLKLAKSAIGEKYLELVDETGQTVIQKMETLNPGEQHRQSSNTDTFKGKLGEIGAKLQEGKELIFKDISSITDELKAVIESSSYGTSEEKANALKEVLEKAGLDTTEFVKMSISDRIDKVKALVGEGELLGGTADTQFAEVKKEIQEKIAGYDKTLANVLGRIGNTQLDEFNNALKEAETIKSEGGEKANIAKILAYKASVEEMIKKGYLKAEEASDMFKLAGIENVDVQVAKDGSIEFKKSIDTLIKTGTKKINDGMTGVKEVDITEIKTEDLFTTAQALAVVVRQHIESAISKLNEAISKAKSANNWDEVADLANERNLSEERINSSFRYAGGIIPEYHSNGLGVGINWKRRGTDTVPTMLTPGEYVLRKKAVDSLGTNFLNNLNKFGVNALQSVGKSTIINNIYNTNNAKISQNIDNKSQYLNGMFGVDKLMRYV
nr:MAG TPA: tail tape measure [Caudoviricetes sp.]